MWVFFQATFFFVASEEQKAVEEATQFHLPSLTAFANLGFTEFVLHVGYHCQFLHGCIAGDKRVQRNLFATHSVPLLLAALVHPSLINGDPTDGHDPLRHMVVTAIFSALSYAFWAGYFIEPWVRRRTGAIDREAELFAEVPWHRILLYGLARLWYLMDSLGETTFTSVRWTAAFVFFRMWFTATRTPSTWVTGVRDVPTASIWETTLPLVLAHMLYVTDRIVVHARNDAGEVLDSEWVCGDEELPEFITLDHPTGPMDEGNPIPVLPDALHVRRAIIWRINEVMAQCQLAQEAKDITPHLSQRIGIIIEQLTWLRSLFSKQTPQPRDFAQTIWNHFQSDVIIYNRQIHVAHQRYKLEYKRKPGYARSLSDSDDDEPAEQLQREQAAVESLMEADIPPLFEESSGSDGDEEDREYDDNLKKNYKASLRRQNPPTKGSRRKPHSEDKESKAQKKKHKKTPKADKHPTPPPASHTSTPPSVQQELEQDALEQQQSTGGGGEIKESKKKKKSQKHKKKKVIELEEEDDDPTDPADDTPNPGAHHALPTLASTPTRTATTPTLSSTPTAATTPSLSSTPTIPLATAGLFPRIPLSSHPPAASSSSLPLPLPLAASGASPPSTPAHSPAAIATATTPVTSIPPASKHSDFKDELALWDAPEDSTTAAGQGHTIAGHTDHPSSVPYNPTGGKHKAAPGSNSGSNSAPFTDFPNPPTPTHPPSDDESGTSDDDDDEAEENTDKTRSRHRRSRSPSPSPQPTKRGRRSSTPEGKRERKRSTSPPQLSSLSHPPPTPTTALRSPSAPIFHPVDVSRTTRALFSSPATISPLHSFRSVLSAESIAAQFNSSPLVTPIPPTPTEPPTTSTAPPAPILTILITPPTPPRTSTPPPPPLSQALPLSPPRPDTPHIDSQPSASQLPSNSSPLDDTQPPTHSQAPTLPPSGGGSQPLDLEPTQPADGPSQPSSLHSESTQPLSSLSSSAPSFSSSPLPLSSSQATVPSTFTDSPTPLPTPLSLDPNFVPDSLDPSLLTLELLALAPPKKTTRAARATSADRNATRRTTRSQASSTTTRKR